ncbi:MAG: hotdog fold thioesterase [Candidatus Sericytochromatia bacterium]
MSAPDFTRVSIDTLNAWGHNTASESLGIEFTEIGPDYLIARMPVDARTHQPAGLLHGGASVLLAETLGSVAGTLSIDAETQACVGLEINANHVRGVRSGWVYGRVSALHVGRSTQLWEIRISNEADQLVCISRLTIAVIEKRQTEK